MPLSNPNTNQIENRTNQTIVRRAIQLFVLILTPIIVFACTDAVEDPVSEEAPEVEALAITPDWIQNNAGSSTLAHELNEVRKATQKYKDVAEARAAGYEPDGFYVPGMGCHFTNPDLIAEDETEEVDITEPPILVYFTTGDVEECPGPGDANDHLDEYLRLGAVEYVHLGDEGPPGTPANYFSDEDAPRNLNVSEEEGWVWTPGPDITALHVWLHRGNPDGVFAPFNPTVD